MQGLIYKEAYINVHEEQEGKTGAKLEGAESSGGERDIMSILTQLGLL